MARVMAELVLSETERAELKQLSSRRKTAQALALRARIVLECAQGLENQEVAAGLGVAKNTVGKWRRRFVERRIDGLHDEPRSGAPRSKSQIQALDRSQPMLAERTFCSAGATKLKVDDGAMSLAYLRTITVRGIASLSACCLRSLAIGPSRARASNTSLSDSMVLACSSRSSDADRCERRFRSLSRPVL